MNPHIFREFSIRGIADRELTDDVVIRIGQAIGTFFGQRKHRSLVIGNDARLSSNRINKALIEGLLQTGLDLIEIGQVPTPVLNFSTDFYKADGGIMITASHNPPDYNGLKIRDEKTIQGDDLKEIYNLAQTILPSSESQGLIKRVDPFPDYLKQLKSHVNWGKQPIKVVVDGGNGTNGQIVSTFLREMGCVVKELYCEPDGNFPNRSPDPTAKGATAELAMAVLAQKADLGIAYDGDGDRLVVVDDQGTTILGDQLMMLLSRDILRYVPAKVVYEILCTQALADDIIAHGGIPIMTPSGYAFVHTAMQETGAALGGELSGHLFFNEPHFQFDDAILASIKILNILGQTNQTLSGLTSHLPSYYSSPEIRLKCPDELKAVVVNKVHETYHGKYKIEEIDGARIHFPGGWALVRQSNTQPVLSMRFEARSHEQMKEIQAEIQALVESLIKNPNP